MSERAPPTANTLCTHDGAAVAARSPRNYILIFVLLILLSATRFLHHPRSPRFIFKCKKNVKIQNLSVQRHFPFQSKGSQSSTRFSCRHDVYVRFKGQNVKQVLFFPFFFSAAQSDFSQSVLAEDNPIERIMR